MCVDYSYNDEKNIYVNDDEEKWNSLFGLEGSFLFLFFYFPLVVLLHDFTLVKNDRNNKHAIPNVVEISQFPEYSHRGEMSLG